MLKNLKDLREETGISQRQLAEAVAVSQQSINKYENHNIEPDIETMIRIADHFHTTVDYLIGHSDLRWPTAPPAADGWSFDELRLIDQYRKLTVKQQACLRSIADCLSDDSE